MESLSKNGPLDGGVNFQEIAEMSESLTGADLKSLLYNAQLQAAHKTLKDIGQQEKQNEDSIHRLDPEFQAVSDKNSLPSEGRKGARRALVFKITPSGIEKETNAELQDKVSYYTASGPE